MRSPIVNWREALPLCDAAAPVRWLLTTFAATWRVAAEFCSALAISAPPHIPIIAASKAGAKSLAA